MNIYSWFVRGEEHAAMCRTSIASVRKVDPESRCIVVSDEQRPKWEVEAIRMECDTGPIMLANLEAQVNAMGYAMGHKARKITFLDTDTIFLKPFECAGVVDFTWRDSIGNDNDGEPIEGIAARMPYNYGVVGAKPSLSALECFIWMRERIRNMHETHQQWYGNQLAAVELAGKRPDSGITVEVRQLPWKLTSLGRKITIGKLPCAVYNYTPQKVGEDVSQKAVLHFKGKKRALMGHYAVALGLPWDLPLAPIEQERPPLALVNVV